MQIAGRQIRLHEVYRGWWVVGAVFLSSAVVIGSSQYAFGLFVRPLEESFGWSRTQISASLSFTAVGSLLAPFIGRLMDRHGARRIMAVSLGFLGLSYLLRPLMTELWHWYTLSLLQFVGFSGAAALPAGRLVGIWFQKTRGRMMGLTAMGNNFGGLVVPPIVGAALMLVSWQGAYLALAALVLAVILLALTAIREFPSKRDLARGEAYTDSAGGRGRRAVVLTGWTVREAIRTRAFYAIMLAVLLGSFTYSAVLPQVTAHLTNEGHAVAVASAALSVLAIFGMLGKLALGYLAERITTRYTLMIDLVGQALFLFLMTYAASPVVMWVSVPLFGFFMGGFGALFQLIVQDAFGIRYFGSIMGLVNLTSVVTYLAGPLLAGLSFDVTGSYRMAFMIVAGLFAIGALVLTQARAPKAEAAASGI